MSSVTGDPTAISFHDEANSPDPTVRRMRGIAHHGHTPFDVPFVSHIVGNLYSGGCESGLTLPHKIKHVVSLYQWEQYWAMHELDSSLTVKQYDNLTTDLTRIKATVQWAVHAVESGPTLIHCQAGLNRSGLISALTLLEHGDVDTADEAIDLLRERRSPAVLCNPAFVEFIHDWLN